MHDGDQLEIRTKLSWLMTGPNMSDGWFQCSVLWKQIHVPAALERSTSRTNCYLAKRQREHESCCSTAELDYMAIRLSSNCTIQLNSTAAHKFHKLRITSKNTQFLLWIMRLYTLSRTNVCDSLLTNCFFLIKYFLSLNVKTTVKPAVTSCYSKS